jgi:hypothetical protein
MTGIARLPEPMHLRRHAVLSWDAASAGTIARFHVPPSRRTSAVRGILRGGAQ